MSLKSTKIFSLNIIPFSYCFFFEIYETRDTLNNISSQLNHTKLHTENMKRFLNNFLKQRIFFFRSENIRRKEFFRLSHSLTRSLWMLQFSSRKIKFLLLCFMFLCWLCFAVHFIFFLRCYCSLSFTARAKRE